MYIKLFLTLMCFISYAAAQFQGDQQFPQLNNDPRFDSRISSLISRNVLQLAQDISKSVLKTSTQKTEVFSPLSIWGALSLLLLGAGGKTHRELMQLLHFSNGMFEF